MNPQFHYDTITEAIKQLRGKGYTYDFDFFEGKLKSADEVSEADELEISDLYRYEGETYPADKAAVFALSSPSGLKGIFVTGLVQLQQMGQKS